MKRDSFRNFLASVVQIGLTIFLASFPRRRGPRTHWMSLGTRLRGYDEVVGSGESARTVLLAAFGFVLLLGLSSPQRATAQTAGQANGRVVRFSTDIRPLLSDRCFHCHGPDEESREAELRLDIAPEPDHIVVPGMPAESELFRRITSTDPDEQMPPPGHGKPLTNDEISLLRRWIQGGGKWSAHWAYEKPVRTKDPNVVVDNSSNWIDRFIDQRLADESLELSPEADRVTLLRRVSFDLTGLPPTPNEVDAFVADKSADAWEKVVDRLLAVDEHGERMATYWLDLVRYADTVGYHGDQDHAISPYRDWVIDAFIDNMPFDRFTAEQLAGDLVEGSGIDQKIASGYNRLLQTTHEGGLQPKEYLAIYAADRIRNLSEVWMGGTMGCCQCHNHKFDPYTIEDFYSMGAFFADLDEAKHFTSGGNSLPTKREPELVVLTRRERLRIKELDQKIGETKAAVASLASDDAERSKLEATITELTKEKAAISKGARRTMISASIKPRTMRVLPRGNWLDDNGPIVTSSIPKFLGELGTGDQRSTRLDLANWLTDAEDGNGLLTARVFANRFWYLLFGNGIARNLTDFGGQGEPPSHPELLDNLAVEFVDSGWNVRHILKLITMSRAYRQSSLVTDELRESDPENRLFSRQARFRLPAEAVRDNALFVSGLLVQKVGGPSVKPYQPAGYYRHLNFPTRKYVQHNDQRQWRRGLYVHWQRQFLHPMLKAFDAPRREECTAQRPRSNTPLASLTLLNDPTFVEAARAFADRIMTSAEDDQARLDVAFRLAVSRSLEDFERKLLTELLVASREQYRSDEASALALVSAGISPKAEGGSVVEHAAWTAVARAILTLGETTTRN
ncbi:MAG: hypothetical protein ACI93T_001202 [Porticoccaceae bacterium]